MFTGFSHNFLWAGNAQQSLVSDGRRLYGQAVKLVNATIGDPSLLELTKRLGNCTNESQRTLLDAPRLATSTAEDSSPRNFYLLFPLRVADKAFSGSRSLQAVYQKLWLEDVFNMSKDGVGPWTSNMQIFRFGES